MTKKNYDVKDMALAEQAENASNGPDVPCRSSISSLNASRKKNL
jgi:hypothetical protein